MKKHILVLLVAVTASLSLHAEVQPPINNQPIIPRNTINPSPEQRAYEARLEALNQQFKEATCEPFLINEDADGETLHVKLSEIFKIAFQLPKDSENGLTTHSINTPPLREFENPIQGWEDNPSLSDASGGDLDLGLFYGLGDVHSEPHSPALQQGVLHHSSFIANQAGTFPLTFSITTGAWRTDTFPHQYRSDLSTRREITIFVQVDSE